MASSGKKSTNKKTTETKITRISATDNTPKKREKANAEVAKTVQKPTQQANQEKEQSSNVLVAIGRYFGGAWFELRQVRWPTRQATWSMTLAMLIFTAFFVVVILLLDALFKYLFGLILG